MLASMPSRGIKEKESDNESESEIISLLFLIFTLTLFLSRNMFDFQKLEVYKKSKVFHVSCKTLILKYKFDRYVNDQLGRASFSVPLNIAEGSGKFSSKDRKNYFTTARASVFECVAVLDILSDENSISEEELEMLMKNADELSRILYVMIKNLG